MTRRTGLAAAYKTLCWCAIIAIGCSGDEERGEPSNGGNGGSAGSGGNDAGLDIDQPGSGDGGVNIDGGGTTDGGASTDDGCGLGCTRNETGAGTDTPFDLDDNPSEGVGLDPDGALILERDEGEAAELIWVANTSEYTVSKVDTANYEELGRYHIPAVDPTINPGENGPSRTSVDSEGNVYAGARMGNGVTKVSAAAEDCPDTNGDGMITTSTGIGDVLPAGEDDCVIWTTDIAGDARGVAVQEIPARVEVEMAPDEEPVVTEFPAERYVWVGGHDTERLHKIDAETGEILFSIDPPTAVYGLALDGRGNLWIAAQKERAFGRVDTTRCVDASCGTETVCATICTEADCPDICDNAVLERIEPRDSSDMAMSSYGITVDCNQRVWLGGAWAGEDQILGIKRYDPLADPADRLSLVTMIAGAQDDGVHGIAADANGFVWGAGGLTGVWRIDSDSLDFVQVAGTGGEEFQAKGIALDRQGKVWAIPLRESYAMVITPGATLNDATVDKPMDGFVGPYTYSDMSGEQRRLAANEPGTYRQLFEGCSDETLVTQWQDLEWDVATPMGTYVVFRARTADNVVDLEDAEWFPLTAVPGGMAPLPIAQLMEAADQESGRYLEVEVQLITTELGSESKDGCTVTSASSPRVRSFAVTHLCDNGLE
jgi:streptogramin lyase